MEGAGILPNIEETLTTRPLPWARIWGSTAAVIRITPKTLMSKTSLT
jgi:hypothetical protein